MQVLAGYLLEDEVDRGPGLRVKLRVDDDSVTLESDSETLGRWSYVGAAASQLATERFLLSFGDEEFVFVPDDSVDFKYEVMPKLKPAPATTRRLRRSANRAEGDVKKVAPKQRVRDLPSVAPLKAEISEAEDSGDPWSEEEPEEFPDAEVVAVDEAEPTATPTEKPVEAASPNASPKPDAVATSATRGGLLDQLRNRDDEDEHHHRFERQSLPGGLVRVVCAECGHVSIDLTDQEASDETGPDDRDGGSRLFTGRLGF